MVYFQTKNTNLGKFGRAFCVHLVHFSGFGILQREESGSRVWNDCVSAFQRSKETRRSQSV
jgi:hypothetical protein